MKLPPFARGVYSDALILFGFFFCAVALAQDLSLDRATTDAQAGSNSVTLIRLPAQPWRAAQRRADETLWHSVQVISNAVTTEVQIQTNSYVELGGGLNTLGPDGQYVASDLAFEITANGAEAKHAAHTMTLPANINAGSMIADFADGTRLEARPLLFGYHDPVDGRTVVLSELTDAGGSLVSSNVVVYSNCFSRIKASIRFRNTLGGPAQDLILHEQLPGPEEFGLSSSSRLEMFTELLGQTPVPIEESRVIRQEQDPARRAAMLEPTFSDVTLHFGSVRMAQGRAFSVGGGATDRQTEVGKFYFVNPDDGRRVLIEAVEHQSIKSMLTNLPPANVDGVKSAAIYPRRVLPVARMAAKKNPDERIQVAALELNPSKLAPLAFVLDYETVGAGTKTDFVFAGSTNYLIADGATVTLQGNTIIEGGTVIKYGNASSLLDVAGTINFRTSRWQPAVFTCRNDDTVGEAISGGAQPAPMGTLKLSSSTISGTIKHVQFRYAANAVWVLQGAPEFRHLQFVSCTKAFTFGQNGSVYVGNALFHNVTATVFDTGTSTTTVTGEHLTADNCPTLGTGSGGFIFRNCVFANCGTVTSPSSSFNAFLNTSAFGSSQIPLNPSPFQTVGDGAHYLAIGSAARNAGTAGINPSLLTEISDRTVDPPQHRNGGSWSANWIISPSVLRDNDSLPDCGYHYEPLDWIATGVTMFSSANVIVTNGAALGIRFASSKGIYLQDYAKFISHGSWPTQNFVGRAHLVQEQPSSATTGWYPLVSSSGSFYCAMRYRHTTLPTLAGGHYYFYGGAESALEFTHCDLKCGQVWYGQTSYNARQIGLTNNLLFRTSLTLGGNDQNVTLYSYNNLFFRGSVIFNAYGGYYNNSWLIKDNVFDKTAISQSAYALNGADHNGYVTGSPRISPQRSLDDNDRAVSSISYDYGSRGQFFIVDNSAFENHGSRTAVAAGLSQFTTRTDQRKDASDVDMGVHFVAADAGGNAQDYDQDGLPDYFEDSSGDGAYGSGDLADYRNKDSDGDGLDDRYEFAASLTNPNLANTSGTGAIDGYKDSDLVGQTSTPDGLLNQEEMQSGKNPLVPDVATPVFSPVGGTYGSDRMVTITCDTPGATIYYTTDGSEPTINSAVYLSALSVPVVVNGDQSGTLLKAKAFKSNWTPSDTETERYQAKANSAPTVSVLPATGAFSASDSIEILVQGADANGTIKKLQLYRGTLKVAEAVPGPLRYTLNNVPSGSYTFTARAIDNEDAVTASSSVTININSPGPVVSLVGAQPFFTSSPGALIATITGVNPGSLSSVTLNGSAVPVRAGEFFLYPNLVEGENTFTLTVNGTVSATTKVYLDTVLPVISITKPVNGSTLGTTRINVTGSFTETSLKRITVNGVLTFVPPGGTTFEARNVPLEVGANTITATAEDISGNTASATISVTGSASPVDPIQLTVTPVAGFAPLSTTFTLVGNFPGTLQNVYYDFNGNGVMDPGQDQTETSLSSIPHIYNDVGQYFPVVTVETLYQGQTLRFSSVGGWNASPALRINVQTTPSVLNGSGISISDPVDLKIGGPSSHLFVLSRSGVDGEHVKEYDPSSNPETPGLSITLPSGSVPTGLDVDSEGNVYVALSGHHQVAKYKLNVLGTAYELDGMFNPTGPTPGKIGNDNHTSGTGNSQFNTPYDVAVSPDGAQIAVSDSLNHRIQTFRASDGSFIGTFGTQGSSLGQFNMPKGLTYDGSGYLYIVDSGNNRIALAVSFSVIGTSGASGAALGQFSGAVNLCVGPRGIYVGETGNNRVQAFDRVKTGHGSSPTPFDVRLALSTGLNQPGAVAPITDFLTEQIYVADTGSGHVLKFSFPETSTPDAAWGSMMLSLSNGNIDQALDQFSALSAEDYRISFLMIGSSGIASIVSDIGNLTLTPEVIEGDAAEYSFDRVIGGQTATFPVEFVKENGIWKILEF